MAALSARERTLLKQHHLDGLSAREIAKLRRVHHGTAARWLEAARDAVLARTRESLMAQLSIDRSEFESVIRLLQSRWEVTVGRFLDRASGASEEGEEGEEGERAGGLGRADRARIAPGGRR